MSKPLCNLPLQIRPADVSHEDTSTDRSNNTHTLLHEPVYNITCYCFLCGIGWHNNAAFSQRYLISISLLHLLIGNVRRWLSFFNSVCSSLCSDLATQGFYLPLNPFSSLSSLSSLILISTVRSWYFITKMYNRTSSVTLHFLNIHLYFGHGNVQTNIYAASPEIAKNPQNVPNCPEQAERWVWVQRDDCDAQP